MDISPLIERLCTIVLLCEKFLSFAGSASLVVPMSFQNSTRAMFFSLQRQVTWLIVEWMICTANGVHISSSSLVLITLTRNLKLLSFVCRIV